MCVNKRGTHTHSHQPDHDQRPPDVKVGCISGWQWPFVCKYIRRVSHFYGKTESDGTAHMKLEMKLWAGVVTSAKQIPLWRLTATFDLLDSWTHATFDFLCPKRKKYCQTQNSQSNSCSVLNLFIMDIFVQWQIESCESHRGREAFFFFPFLFFFLKMLSVILQHVEKGINDSPAAH